MRVGQTLDFALDVTALVQNTHEVADERAVVSVGLVEGVDTDAPGGERRNHFPMTANRQSEWIDALALRCGDNVALVCVRGRHVENSRSPHALVA